MNRHFRRLHNPVYLIILFGLVAYLSSSLAWLGTEGSTFAVLGAGGIILTTPFLLGKLRQGWKGIISGKPTKMDFIAAPSGYRRARYAESEVEQVKQSVVIPTPNRPLLLPEHKQPTRTPVGPYLALSPAWNPHIDDIIGHSICGLGMRGSGKTTLAARLIERIGLLPNTVPMVIFDDAQDYATLPDVLERAVIAGSPTWSERGQYGDDYWEVTEDIADTIGYEILERGLQLILQLHTYSSLEEAARIMCGIIDGLFAWASDQHPDDRVPCLVFLDEAQKYLPQDRSVSPIAQEETKQLLVKFDAINSTGRKKGLTPCIFTQRPAQIQKPAIAGSEIYFLGLQTFPNDLDKYEELVGKQNIDRNVVQKFKAGDFALFVDGELDISHVYPRQSEHRGSTPSYEQAGNRYKDASVTKKFSSVETARLPESNFSSSLSENDDFRTTENSFRNHSHTENAILTPILPEKGPRADDIDINVAITLWNNGYGSEDKLMKAFPGMTKYQAGLLRDKIVAQASKFE
jgi:hypothetical protein